MESKVPFIAEYDPYSVTRPLKRYRPISTRPWTLLFFLAATGICFGLLLAISLVEKDPLPFTKRDLEDADLRYALFQRQDSAAATSAGASSTLIEASSATASAYLSITSQPAASSSGAEISITSQCTDYVTETFTSCTAASGYQCPSDTAAASTAAGAAATTGLCYTSTLTETIIETGSLLSLVSQCTSYAVGTVVECSAATGYGCPDPPTSTIDPAAATIGSCITTTTYVTVVNTGSLLSLTSQCTTAAVGTVVECNAQTGYVCPDPPTSTIPPAAAATGECVTTTTYVTVINTGSLLSLNTQPASPTPTEVSSAMSSALLSLTSQSTAPAYSAASQSAQATIESSSVNLAETSSLISLISQAPTRPEQIPDVTLSPSPSSLAPSTVSQISDGQPATFLSMTSSTASAIGPLVNPVPTASSPTSTSTDSVAVYTLTFEDLTETLSLTSNEATIVAASSATYLVVLTSDGVEIGSYAAESSVSLLNQGGSFTRTDAPSITAAPTLTPITTIMPTSTSTTSEVLNTGLKKDLVLVKLESFHPYYYFLAVYLPKILAVVMAILWGVIFAGLKLMEPFYQLSAATGALAGDTMFGNYLASELNLLSLSAIFHGQWILLLGGAITILWAAIVALTSESMSVISLGRCVANGHHFRCDPAWAVSPIIIKVLLTLTGLVFILVMILMLMLSQRKRTGCFHDPSSIAAMTELLGNPQVMKDFRDIKPSSSDRDVKLHLGDNRYKIGLYDPSSGKEAHAFQHDQSRWGLIKIAEATIEQKIARRKSTGYSAVLNPTVAIAEEEKANRKRRVVEIVYHVTLLLVALCVFAIALGYYLDGKSDPFNNFFNSAVFGPQFVLSCLALILAIGWRRIAAEMTVMAPYRSMARAFEGRSGVQAERSILVRPARSPWRAIFRGFKAQNYMVVIVAVCALLADILLIAVSGLPYSSGQTLLSLRVSTFTSLAILGIMILTAIAVLGYSRTSAGGTRKLPRNPDTLLGVWLYLCHSKLVPSTDNTAFDDFSSPLDDEELKAKYSNYSCGFTRKEGADGVKWWTIDSVASLEHSDPIPAMSRPYTQYQNSVPRPGDDAYQAGPQPYEASATPIHNPYEYFPPQNDPSQGMTPSVTATADGDPRDTTYNIAIPGYQSQRRSQHRPSQQQHDQRVLPFEAQARSPAPQSHHTQPHITSNPRYENLRPHRLRGQDLSVVTSTAPANTTLPSQQQRYIQHQQSQLQRKPVRSSRFEERDVDETSRIDTEMDIPTTPAEALLAYEYENEYHGHHETVGSMQDGNMNVAQGQVNVERVASQGSSVYSQYPSLQQSQVQHQYHGEFQSQRMIQRRFERQRDNQDREQRQRLVEGGNQPMRGSGGYDVGTVKGRERWSNDGRSRYRFD